MVKSWGQWPVRYIGNVAWNEPRLWSLKGNYKGWFIAIIPQFPAELQQVYLVVWIVRSGCDPIPSKEAPLEVQLLGNYSFFIYDADEPGPRGVPGVPTSTARSPS